MKSMHFCTPNKLLQLKNEIYFDSIRTGFIPQYRINETIKITNFITKDIICYAEVISIKPIQFRDIDKKIHEEEIHRYIRKFHPEQYFFIIKLKKV